MILFTTYFNISNLQHLYQHLIFSQGLLIGEGKNNLKASIYNCKFCILIMTMLVTERLIIAKQRVLILLKAEKSFIKITYFPTLEEKGHTSSFTIFSNFLVIQTYNLTLSKN